MSTSAIFALVIVIVISYNDVTSYPNKPRIPRQIMRPTSTTIAPVPGVVYTIPNCNCQTTSEYNPVCGSNGVTYQNRQKLECASSCGTDSTLMANSTCNEYYFTVCDNECPVNIQGVCASNSRTYKSDCSVDCYSIFLDRTVYVLHQGSCRRRNPPPDWPRHHD